MRKILTPSSLPIVLVAALLAPHGGAQAPGVAPASPVQDSAPASAALPAPPQVEVVFVLDTTGSMSNLIEGAKAKIWSIANRIADGDPVPDLRFGLVAYRDNGDEYVTRTVPLTADLDHVYAELMGFGAAGGGDGPEHVNAALHDAVFAFDWSAQDDHVLKLVFLVGDAPPHMDYDDGMDYREICQEAVKRGLIINTVRCGGDENCATFWSDIAKRAEGRFTTIGQDGGMVAVSTPVDARLADLSARLSMTHLGYGDAERLRRATELKDGASAPMPASAAADKAEFSAKKSGYVAEHDLLDALRDGDTVLEELAEEELPEELRGLGDEERKRKLDQIQKDRAALVKEIDVLSLERQEFLRAAQEKERGGAASSFDDEVLKMLRAQAAKKGIRYELPNAGGADAKGTKDTKGGTEESGESGYHDHTKDRR